MSSLLTVPGFASPDTLTEVQTTAIATWTTAAEPGSWRSNVWSPELNLFAASGNTLVGRSTDGINWTTVTVGPIIGGATWVSITWSPELSLFATVGLTTGITMAVAISSDGISWTTGDLGPGLALASIAWSPKLALFVTTTISLIAQSMDGLTWSTQTLTGFWAALTWSPELGLFLNTGQNVRATSPDGINWTTATETGTWTSSTWSPELGLFVIVGTNIRATSPDGIIWTTATETGSWTSVIWASDISLFSMVGTNIRATSTDGISWTTVTQTNGWTTIAWSPSLSIFSSFSTNEKMYTSPDYSGLVQTSTNGTQGITDYTILGNDISIGQSANIVEIGKYANSLVLGSSGTTIDLGGTLMGVSYIRDEKASGVNGGTFTLGAWRTRDLNTITNYGKIKCTLNSNQFTLGSGNYFLMGSAPGFIVTRNKGKIRRITAPASDVIIGSSIMTNGTFVSPSTFIYGFLNISEETVTYEFQHRSTNTRAADGFGVSSNFGVVEIYTQVLIFRLF